MPDPASQGTKPPFPVGDKKSIPDNQSIAKVPPDEIVEAVEEGINKDPILREIIPPDIRNRIAEGVVSVTYQAIRSEFSGCLPPPEMLTEYQKIIPNCGERMLSMVEKQQSHRMAVENKFVENSHSQTKSGQICGVIVTGFLVTAIIACAYFKQVIPASIGFAFVSIIGIFNKYYKPKEEEEEVKKEPEPTPEPKPQPPVPQGKQKQQSKKK